MSHCVTNENDLSPCAFMICQYLSGNKMPITEHSIARECFASQNHIKKDY